MSDFLRRKASKIRTPGKENDDGIADELDPKKHHVVYKSVESINAFVDETYGTTSEAAIGIQLCVLSVGAFRHGYYYELIDKEAEGTLEDMKTDLNKLSMQARNKYIFVFPIGRRKSVHTMLLP